MNKQISEMVDKMCNAQYKRGKQDTIVEVEKLVDKEIAKHEHCRGTCESQELDTLEELKTKLDKLKEEIEFLKILKLHLQHSNTKRIEQVIDLHISKLKEAGK